MALFVCFLVFLYFFFLYLLMCMRCLWMALLLYIRVGKTETCDKYTHSLPAVVSIAAYLLKKFQIFRNFFSSRVYCAWIHWRKKCGRNLTLRDISTFLIPLEGLRWGVLRNKKIFAVMCGAIYTYIHMCYGCTKIIFIILF